MATGSTISRSAVRAGAALVAVALVTLSAPLSPAQPGVLTTEYDDIRAGKEGAAQVAAEMGILDSPELQAYVEKIGRRLVRGVPRRSFHYEFAIVDQSAPNAFALPGGFIYVSRGLLALANNEDEIANVIGHEITHAARRHAAAKQRRQRQSSGLLSPWLRGAGIAAYSRDMERDADRGGQKLAAAAGYDPIGMATFMRRLGNMERMRLGFTRMPSWFDTHPGSRERATHNSMRAQEIRWTRDPKLGDTERRFFEMIEGIPLGQRPEAGVFVGDRFLHIPMDFHMRFPPTWNKQNTNRVVGAMSPEAVVYMTAEAPTESAEAAAKEFEKELAGQPAAVRRSRPVKIGHIPSWRLEIEASSGRTSVLAYVTFIPYHDMTIRVTGVAAARQAQSVRGRILNTARSFRPLTLNEKTSVRATRLRVVQAREGEDLEAIARRTGNVMPVMPTAVLNGLFTNHRFEGGERLKIARAEPFLPR
jgi:predicted Zn-dependent protease